jgi:hypothetical protein
MAIRPKDGVAAGQPISHRAKLAALYEHDYYTWTGAQAQALRERKGSGLDWDNLAEEVEDLGKAERHRLESPLESLLMHLLKWAYQPERRSRSKSIREHRFRILRVLRDNPGLKAKLAEIFADAYAGARFSAENEAGLDISALAESCPWSVDDVMRADFLPESSRKNKLRRLSGKSQIMQR